MDIWGFDKLIIFILFVIPGFVSMKVYDLFIPSKYREVWNSILHAITYSCVYYALVSWLLVLAHTKNFISNPGFIFLLLFVFPAIMGGLFVCLRKTRFFTAKATHPIPTPWDYVFGGREAYWIIITLNDGNLIGGTYDTDSFTSSYPEEPQIYIQEVWELSIDKKFLKAIGRSRGALVFGKDIKQVEFYQ